MQHWLHHFPGATTMDPYIEDLGAALHAAPPVAARGTAGREPSSRECPVCHKRMVVERQNGVAVDVCADHGVWFDLGELPTLLDRVRAGEKVGRATALADARQEGKISGALFGLLSLLFD